MVTLGSLIRAPWLFPSLAIGLLCIFVFGPLAGRGYIFLLDYGAELTGPRPRLPDLTWGLLANTNAMTPIHVVQVRLFEVVSSGWIRLVPFVAVPFIAFAGFRRLAPSRSVVIALGATLLLVVNPFTYERLYAGQVHLMLGVALLPYLIFLLGNDVGGKLFAHIAKLALVLAVLFALAPHFLFIAALPVGLAIMVAMLRLDKAALIRLAGGVCATAVLCAYWIFPTLMVVGDLGRVTVRDLDVFSTSSDRTFGLIPNVLGLYGFWTNYQLPKHHLVIWPALLLLLLCVICVGMRFVLTSKEYKVSARFQAVLLIPSAVIGLFLAMGAQGPTGSIFEWMFENIPGFQIMREPHKFLALTLVAYAYYFGAGAHWLIEIVRTNYAKLLTVGLLVTLVCAYTFKLFWGFNGQVEPVSYPNSWAEADAEMGEGDGYVLALPWHLYIRFPWVGRTVANPMGSYFRREVIFGDNIEIGRIKTQSVNPRSLYLQYLFSKGRQIRRFGNLVSPLNIQFILLAETPGPNLYRWLKRQEDLSIVRTWDDLVLFRNEALIAEAYAPAEELTVENWGEVIDLSEQASLLSFAINVKDPMSKAPPTGKKFSVNDAATEVLEVQSRSPVHLDVSPRDPSDPAVVARPFHPGWELQGAPATPNMGVTLHFEAAQSGKVFFSPWNRTRIGYLVSGGMGLLLIAYLGAHRITRWRRRPQESPLDEAKPGR